MYQPDHSYTKQVILTEQNLIHLRTAQRHDLPRFTTEQCVCFQEIEDRTHTTDWTVSKLFSPQYRTYLHQCLYYLIDMSTIVDAKFTTMQHPQHIRRSYTKEIVQTAVRYIFRIHSQLLEYYSTSDGMLARSDRILLLGCLNL